MKCCDKTRVVAWWLVGRDRERWLDERWEAEKSIAARSTAQVQKLAKFGDARSGAGGAAFVGGRRTRTHQSRIIAIQIVSFGLHAHTAAHPGASAKQHICTPPAHQNVLSAGQIYKFIWIFAAWLRGRKFPARALSLPPWGFYTVCAAACYSGWIDQFCSHEKVQMGWHLKTFPLMSRARCTHFEPAPRGIFKCQKIIYRKGKRSTETESAWMIFTQLDIIQTWNRAAYLYSLLNIITNLRNQNSVLIYLSKKAHKFKVKSVF